jgi:hypothetical protein
VRLMWSGCSSACVDGYGNFNDAQPSTYKNMSWAIFFTEVLLKDEDLGKLNRYKGGHV